MKDPIISTKELVKNYGQGDSISRALRGLSIDIYPGEFVIVFGPSGSGKSTLLNIVSGLEEPTSGKVTIDSQDISSLDDNEKARFHREKIGMVFQAYNLIPSLTVKQNITLPLVFSRVEKDERDRRAKELLKDFGLDTLLDRLPTEISGGQAQRVGIMRALVNKPPIIIADEPTGNLDSEAAKKVMDLLTDLNENYQNTLIIVTHDSSLFNYADRIIFVLDGKVVKETTRERTRSVKTEKKPKVREIIFDLVVKKETDAKRRKVLDILAVLLTRSHLESFDERELKKTVDYILERMSGKMTQKQLYQALDKPLDDGGAGLYEPTAKLLTEGVESIIKLAL